MAEKWRFCGEALLLSEKRMARGKVHLRKIENPVNRKVTFSKRKGGMLKKAQELSVLCDAEVGLIILSQTGKLYEFANPSMNRMIENYHKYFTSAGSTIELSDNVELLCLELENLHKRILQLQKAYKHMIGEDLELLNFKNLQHLERKINVGVGKIHSKKEKMSLEHVRSLKVKEKSLKVENAHLTEKVHEKSRRTKHLDIDIMEGVTNVASPQDEHQTDLNLCLL